MAYQYISFKCEWYIYYPSHEFRSGLFEASTAQIGDIGCCPACLRSRIHIATSTPSAYRSFDATTPPAGVWVPVLLNRFAYHTYAPEPAPASERHANQWRSCTYGCLHHARGPLLEHSCSLCRIRCAGSFPLSVKGMDADPREIQATESLPSVFTPRLQGAPNGPAIILELGGTLLTARISWYSDYPDSCIKLYIPALAFHLRRPPSLS